MSPKVHVPCGVFCGAVIYMMTKNFVSSVCIFLGNWICDVDHIIEYAIYCKKTSEKPSLKRFFGGEYFAEKKKIAVVFHGYEYLFLLFMVGLFLFLNSYAFYSVVMAFSIGYMIHLILDLIGNNCTLKGYSIIYRIMVRFDIGKICD